MKKIIFITLLFPFFLMCQNKEEKKETPKQTASKIENYMIEETLIKQLEQGANRYALEEGIEIPKDKFTKIELDVSSSLAEKILESNGYKFPSQSEFTEIIKQKLNRIIDNSSNNEYLYVNFFDKCDRDFNYYPYNGVDYNGVYIIKNTRFITKFYFIPEIIAYQKEFPKIAKIENSITIDYSKGNENYSIELWKNLMKRTDEYNLEKQRRFNQQLLISRNKYLFNDDKSQFVWLTANDKYFMRNLVTTFGYTEDLKLLQWVIENTKYDENNLEDFGSLFWTKDCNGKVRLHPNTFKVLQELYKPNDTTEMRFLLNNIQKYIEYLGFDEIDKIKDFGISQTDKIKILTNMVYFAEQYKYNPNYDDTTTKMMGRLRYILDGDKNNIKILEQNNYFNLPKFKEWWDKAKYDKAWVMTCEYEGTCGRDNPQPDPNDYK